MNPSCKVGQVFLSDGRIVLQSLELILACDSIVIRHSDCWEFSFAIGLGDSQLFLHTWQRMIHEPVNYAENKYDYPLLTLTGGYLTPGDQKGYLDGYEGNQYSGANVAYFGNNERGSRRFVRLSGIQTLEMLVHSQELDKVHIKFTCRGDCPMETILQIKDGLIA